MGKSDPAFELRYTLFLDFLGSSHAATNWPRRRRHELVDLLVSLAQLQSAEVITGGAQSDGSYRLNVTPEVTTFSDNAVVSYREASSGRLESVWTGIVCEDAIRVLSGVAEMALRIGLLIRGGLSFGELYHQDGVVFGEAMVDAHTLESQIADKPRVIVSERVIAKLTHERPEHMGTLLQDEDGRWHLNYFRAMVRQSVPPGPEAITQVTRWKNAHLRLIRQNIRDLGSSRPAEKWEWFRERFEHATARFSGSEEMAAISRMDLVPQARPEGAGS